MWMDGRDSLGITDETSESLDESYQPRLQSKLLLETVGEKIRLLRAAMATLFAPDDSLEKKIQCYIQYLQTACQNDQLLKTIPELLNDIPVMQQPARQDDDDDANDALTASRAVEMDSAASIRQHIKTSQEEASQVSLEIMRGLMGLLEQQKNQIEVGQNATEAATTESVAQGPYTKESLLQELQRPRSNSQTVKEKLKAFFQQTFPGDYTFLHLAVLTENALMLRLAIEYQVSPYLNDKLGNQAIHYALRRPNMLLIFLEKPIKLNEFYTRRKTLDNFAALKYEELFAEEMHGYDILNDYRKASFSRSLDFFTVVLTNYLDAVAIQDDIAEEIHAFQKRAQPTPDETLRFSVLMTMSHIHEATKPYQKIIYHLFFNGKVSLKDFDLPSKANPKTDETHIVDLFNKHCGPNVADRELAVTERKQLSVVTRSNLKFIEFISHFRAMHTAILTRFPKWDDNLQIHLQEMVQKAIEEFCSTRLAPLFALLTDQYRQLETATMREQYKGCISAILLTDAPQKGADLLADLIRNIDSANNLIGTINAEGKDTTQEIRMTPSQLLSLHKRSADIIYILRFLSSERRKTAVQKWITQLDGIEATLLTSAASTARNDAAPAANRNSSSSASASPFIGQSKIPRLTLSTFALGLTQPASAANSPRTTPLVSPRHSPAVTPGTSPRGNTTSSPREWFGLHRESTPPASPKGTPRNVSTSSGLERAHSYPGVRKIALTKAAAAAASMAASSNSSATHASVSTSMLAGLVTTATDTSPDTSSHDSSPSHTATPSPRTSNE